MGKTNKVVVFGMKGVGKTSILEQAIYGHITPESFLQSTIEDTYCASIETERGSKERVRFYDTGGKDFSLPLCPNYPLADGFLLVINPSKPETLDWVMQAKRDVDKLREKKEAVFVLLCNQTANSETSQMSRADAWATRERVKVFEVNAMDRSSLYQPLTWITSKMSQPQAKSSFPQLGIRKRD